MCFKPIHYESGWAWLYWMLRISPNVARQFHSNLYVGLPTRHTRNQSGHFASGTENGSETLPRCQGTPVFVGSRRQLPVLPRNAQKYHALFPIKSRWNLYRKRSEKPSVGHKFWEEHVWEFKTPSRTRSNSRSIEAGLEQILEPILSQFGRKQHRNSIKIVYLDDF